MPSPSTIITRLIAALLILSPASPSLAQENAGSSAATSPAWALQCASPNAVSIALECQIVQRFYRQQTRELVMVLAITRRSQDAALSMDLVLPHGLNLVSGVSYWVDSGEKQAAAIASSGQGGAVTSIPVSQELLTALKAGSTLMLQVQTSAGADLSIPVSLAGFTAAIDRMSAIN